MSNAEHLPENWQSALFSIKKGTVGSEGGIPLAAISCHGFDENVDVTTPVLSSTGRADVAKLLQLRLPLSEPTAPHQVLLARRSQYGLTRHRLVES